MTFQKVKENVHVFIDENFYDVIVGAIELPNKLLLIDTGQHLPHLKEFRNQLETETGKKFEIVVLTHYHSDHTFGNQLFTDCRIIATKPIHERMARMKERWDEKIIASISEKLEDKTALEGLVITLPNEEFAGQLDIIDDGIKVIIKHSAGHTKGSTYIYCPNYKVLFTGDNLFEGSYLYGGDPTCNPEIWLNVLKEFLTMDLEYIIPGHGKVANKITIEETISFMEKIKKMMLELAQKGKTKEEIIPIIDEVEFYYYDKNNADDLMLKKTTLERFYDVWIEGKE
ncbi:MAG: MBL fold metallo-hydrolase [Candidatus Thorarchaeota archaeon]